MGGRVTVYDPAALDNARKACPQLRYAGSVRAAAADAQVVLVLTDWPEFSRIDPAELCEVPGVGRGVIDARHALDPQRWRAAGWDYRAPGVPAAPSRLPSAGTPRRRQPATPIDLRALLSQPIEGHRGSGQQESTGLTCPCVRE
jgi:UDPglucose 6-dehydrogenase